jgi:hypothetical protein
LLEELSLDFDGFAVALLLRADPEVEGNPLRLGAVAVGARHD